jgi:hypothetical protein
VYPAVDADAVPGYAGRRLLLVDRHLRAEPQLIDYRVTDAGSGAHVQHIGGDDAAAQVGRWRLLDDAYIAAVHPAVIADTVPGSAVHHALLVDRHLGAVGQLGDRWIVGADAGPGAHVEQGGGHTP